jgi:hypothetical protein
VSGQQQEPQRAASVAPYVEGGDVCIGFTECRCARCVAEKRRNAAPDDDYQGVQCQGCGAVRGGSWLGKPHACWRNQDGTYEEGGTFQ